MTGFSSNFSNLPPGVTPEQIERQFGGDQDNQGSDKVSSVLTESCVYANRIANNVEPNNPVRLSVGEVETIRGTVRATIEVSGIDLNQCRQIIPVFEAFVESLDARA